MGRKLYRGLFALAVLTAFSCCSGAERFRPPPHIVMYGPPVATLTVYITDGFNDRQKRSIIDGVTIWENATQGAVLVSVVGTNPPLSASCALKNIIVIFQSISPNDPNVKTWDESMGKNGPLIGLAVTEKTGVGEDPTIVTVWLVVDRLKDVASEVWVSAHESGHALGLYHIDDTSSIMSPTNNRKQTLSPADVRELCTRLAGCGIVY